jgi:thiol:disulfide interchange protein DsbC
MRRSIFIATLAALSLGLGCLTAISAPADDLAAAKDAVPAKDAPAKDAPAKDAPAKDAPAKDAPAKDAKDPRAVLLKRLPEGSKIEDLRPSPIPGLYEFVQGADVSYLTADGKYFIDGNLYDLDTRENLTEDLRTHARIAMISAVPESQMLIFSPPNPRYTVTVFTDVDCAYCRKLHSQIDEYNKLGVRVRYVFFPRTGPNTESWRKAEAVWCAPNRNEALTRAKTGAAIDLTKTCGQTPVAREYALGQAIGVQGTPAIVAENGEIVGGYLPPQELVAKLKSVQLAKR